MFRVLARFVGYGAKAIKYSWRGAKKGAAWIGTFFKGGSAGKAGPFRRWGGWLWRAADIGLTTWALYDIFAGDDDDVIEARASEMIVDSILNKPVITIINTPVADVEAMAYMFAGRGMELASSDDNMEMLRGISWILVADYITRVGPNSLMYSPEEMKDTLSALASEIATLMGEGETSVDGEKVDVTSTVGEFFDGLEFDNMDQQILKHYDFLTFFFVQLHEITEETEKLGEQGIQSKTTIEQLSTGSLQFKPLD